MKKTGIMHVWSLLLSGLILMGLLQLMSCSGNSGDTLFITNQSANSNPSGDSRADAFATALRSSGYSVGEGSAHLMDPAGYVNYMIVDSAAGNNAGQPYKRLQVPNFPGAEDVSVEKPMGIFRLQPYEAIVYVGPTPPRGDYFSFTPFLWTRLAGKRPGNTKIEGDWVFAALGDPLNNTQIKVEGGGTPFQKNTIVIFTADQGVNDRIVAQAKAAGYPESMINTYILPSKLLNMGVNPVNSANTDDSFLFLVRSANMYNAMEANNYNNNDQYARIFRVTPNTAPLPNPYDTPPMANRKAIAEKDLVHTSKSLDDSLEDLKNAIIAKTAYRDYKPFESIRWFAESRDVLLAGPGTPLYHKFVAGEASDTPYLRTSSGGAADNFTLGKDDMVIVYGVNHEATGLSTYSNFSVYSERVLSPDPSGPYIFGYNDPVWCGIIGMASKDSQDPLYGYNHFTNSAKYYLPDDPNSKYLYAVRVLRQPPPDPERKPWIVVPEPTAEGGPASGIALTDRVTIGYRAYVNPKTGHGPDYGDIIPDRAIWFKVR